MVWKISSQPLKLGSLDSIPCGESRDPWLFTFHFPIFFILLFESIEFSLRPPSCQASPFYNAKFPASRAHTQANWSH